MTANYIFDNNFTKIAARNMLFQQVKNIFPKQTDLRVLTFMGTEPEFELAVSRFYKQSKLKTLEINPNLITKQQEIANNISLTIDLLNMRDLDYFKSNLATNHDVVWLDYCGQRCEASHEAIKESFKSFDLKNGAGLLAITFKKARELDEFAKQAKLSGNKAEREYARMYYAPMLWQSFAVENGLCLTPVYYYTYMDRSERSANPMIMYVFKVSKFENKLPDFKKVKLLDFTGKLVTIRKKRAIK